MGGRDHHPLPILLPSIESLTIGHLGQPLRGFCALRLIRSGYATLFPTCNGYSTIFPTCPSGGPGVTAGEGGWEDPDLGSWDPVLAEFVG